MCQKADAIAACGYAAVAAAAASRKGKRSLAAVDIAPEAVQAEAEPEAVKVHLEAEARPAISLHFPALESYIDEQNVAAALSSPDPKRSKLAAASTQDRIHNVMRSACDLWTAALGGAASSAAPPAQQQLVQVKLEQPERVHVKLEKPQHIPDQAVAVKLEDVQEIKPVFPVQHDVYYLISSSDDEDAQPLTQQAVKVQTESVLVQPEPVQLEYRSGSPGPCPMHENDVSDDDKPLKKAKPASKQAPAGVSKPQNEKASASADDKKSKKAGEAKKASHAALDRGKQGRGLGKKSKSAVVYAEMFGVWEQEIDMKMSALADKGLYSFAAMTPATKKALRTMPKELALKALDEMLDTKEHIDNHNVYFMTLLDGMRTMHNIPQVCTILQRWEYDDYEVPEQDQETMDEWDEVHYAWNIHKDTFVDLVCERMEELNKMKRCSFGKLYGSDAIRQLQTLPAHLAGDLLAKLRDETGTIADVHAYIVKNAKRLRSVHGVKSSDDAWEEIQAQLETVHDTEDDDQ
jgi:hypothetical protein